MTIWEVIAKDPAYSAMADLLIRTGLDSILQRNTVFTVMMPTEASWNQTNLTEQQLRKLAASHISHGIFFSRDITDINQLMSLSGKIIHMDTDGGKIRLNHDVLITHSDIPASNGVIHIINKPLIIRPNLLELIEQEENLSNVAEHLRTNTTYRFNEQRSLPVGMNDLGQTIYDTVWERENPFFSEVADIGSEEQSYTMFLASDELLNTEENPLIREAYLNNLGNFIVKGQLYTSDLQYTQQSVSGITLDFADQKPLLIGRVSNGMAYLLNDFAGAPLPVPFKWEITDVTDFDSIRGVRAVNYANQLDDLEKIRIYDLEGGFLFFSYMLSPDALNNDVLRIQTLAGTYVNVEVVLPDITPGEYKIGMQAMRRRNDGLTFDFLINDQTVRSNVSLNDGQFEYEHIDLGQVTIINRTGNTLTLQIKGTIETHRVGFIDYLFFEPVN